MPSRYQGVAATADSVNDTSAILSFDRCVFGNSELTINLIRWPVGKWICLYARTHPGTDGCALVESALVDGQGLVGIATQSLAIRVRG